MHSECGVQSVHSGYYCGFNLRISKFDGFHDISFREFHSIIVTLITVYKLITLIDQAVCYTYNRCNRYN